MRGSKAAEGRSMRRRPWASALVWLALLGAALAALWGLSRGMSAAWADEDHSGIEYLPAYSDLPDGVQGGEWGTEGLRRSWRHYLKDYGEGQTVNLGLSLNYENDPAVMQRSMQPNNVPTAIRERYPAVFRYSQDEYTFSVSAAKGQYLLSATVSYYPSGRPDEDGPALQAGQALFFWGLGKVLDAIPGEVVSPGAAQATPHASPGTTPTAAASPTQGATRKELLKAKAELIAYHAELLEARTQIIAYKIKVDKIYHYNVAKLVLAVVAEWLNPVRSLPAMAFKTISYLLNQAGLTKSEQRDMEKAEVQHRLLLLSRALQVSADQYLAEAEKARKLLAEINKALKKTPK